MRATRSPIALGLVAMASFTAGCGDKELGASGSPPQGSAMASEPAPLSCQGAGPGLTDCGSSHESCCTSLQVASGTFYRTYANAGGGPTGEAAPASLSAFRLDRYLVTVGRFRRFVLAWTLGAGAPPDGAGKHTHLNDGAGLADSARPGTYEPGWVPSDFESVQPTDDNLSCYGATWTPSVGNRETLPIACVNWYEAYAFCVWDGAFLPSEAEWGYAAAGGNQQRQYAWGSTDPGTANQYEIFDCYYPNGSMICTGAANIAPVGTATRGAGRWGQLDLAGSAWEWTLDWHASYVDPCVDCANLSAGDERALRGGSWGTTYPPPPVYAPPYRNYDVPTQRMGTGFRCARTP